MENTRLELHWRGEAVSVLTFGDLSVRSKSQVEGLGVEAVAAWMPKTGLGV